MVINKHHYGLLALLVVAGLIGGYLLIPDRQDLALMQYRGNQRQNARGNYELLLKGGDLSPGVAVPLARIYLQEGEADRAVGLLERFQKTRPGDAEALRLLGQYYLYAQKPREYFKNLLALEGLEPSAERRREIARMSRQLSEHRQLAQALLALAGNDQATAEEWFELASLQASTGAPGEAAGTLTRWELQSPRDFSTEAKRLLFHLLLDSQQSQEAAQRAGGWLRQQPEQVLAAEFAAALAGRGHSAEAYALLQPFEGSAESSPSSLAQWIGLQIITGHRDEAYSRLTALQEKGRLSDSMRDSLIDLALDRGQDDLALQLSQTARLGPDTHRLLARLALAAFKTHRNAQARSMLRRVPREFLAQQPLLAAELMLADGQKSAARSWLQQVQERDLSGDQKVALAGMWLQLGLDREAFRLFAESAKTSSLPDSALAGLARMYLRGSKAGAGLLFFEQRRREHPSQQAEEGWALLAAAAGLNEALTGWLQGSAASKAGRELFTDLYFGAVQAKRAELALRIARALSKAHPGRNESLLLAEALGNAGKFEEALTLLRPMNEGFGEGTAAYLRTLLAAKRAGVSVDQELRQAAAKQLSNPKLSAEEKAPWIQICADLKEYQAILPYLPDLVRSKGDQWLYPLLEAKLSSKQERDLIDFLKADLQRSGLAYPARLVRIQALLDRRAGADALPFLKEAALRERGSWAAAYIENLRKLNRNMEVREYLTIVADNPSLKKDEKKALALQLLEYEQKESAIVLFKDLAQQAGPDSPEVQQLLFLWGPRPAAPALDWLESRARSARGQEKAAWMNHLTNAGGADRVVQLAHFQPES